MREILTDRLKRLQAALAESRLRALSVVAGPNFYYLTGLSFHLSERPTIGYFPADGDPVFVVPALEETKLTGADLPFGFQYATYTDSEGPDAAFARAAELLVATGVGEGARLGVEMRRMRVMELRLIEESLHSQIAAAEEVLAGLRAVKDPAELGHMRAAVAIAQAALTATLPHIRVGMTERELAAELTAQTLRAGSDPELPFAPIVASGPNSSLPHAFPTERRLAPGDLLTLDWGAASHGYMADLTRTYAVAELPTVELQRIYGLVQGANAAGVAAARPGVACADVDAAARRVIADGGYGEYFVHRVGHGLGLEGHEDPSMHGRNDTPLALGMTFTVEPGIYLPEKGGVRIEDDVVVGADGGISLSDLDRDLRVVA
ncbi:MAG: aminopeptidase P family protein [Anaerolineales bacterium]|nr:aminopeptidase P family protein [Anaerolineales bacterium]